MLPIALVGLLLLASSWWDSAFDLRYWAPLTILTLTLLLAQVAAGALSIPRRGPIAAATAGIWGLAAWALVTALWSDSAAAAWEEAARTAFYAAIWTVAAGSGAIGAWRARLGGALTTGVVLIGIATLVAVLLDGPGQFLAGRLDDPVGYRNGTAALFAFAAWPLVGYAARRGGPAGLRAAAFAATGMLLSLAFMTQSRGVVFGLVLGGVVSLAIGPDRLRRCCLAIAAIVPIAIFSSSLLTPYDAFLDNDAIVTAANIHAASTSVLLITLICGVVGGFVFVFDNGLRLEAREQLRVFAVASLILVVLGAAFAAATRVGDPIDYADSKLKEFSDDEASSTGSTRLASVGGQRSDLWRVALDEFEASPLVGEGAGSYQFLYFQKRDNDRNLNDSHSLPLRVLGDLGLVGASLLGLWLISVAIALRRRASRATEGDRAWIAGLAAAATTVLTQCAIDWLWLLPGVVALAFLALGVAAGGEEEVEVETEPDRTAADRKPWNPIAITVALGLAAAIVSVTFLFLSDFFVRKARVERLASAEKTLSDAEAAAFFNPVAVTPLYLQASALETEGDRGEARERLEEASELEPENFVPYGLLGDLEVRAGKYAAARGYYQEALALNPLDSGLRKLSEGVE